MYSLQRWVSHYSSQNSVMIVVVVSVAVVAVVFAVVTSIVGSAEVPAMEQSSVVDYEIEYAVKRLKCNSAVVVVVAAETPAVDVVAIG